MWIEWEIEKENVMKWSLVRDWKVLKTSKIKEKRNEMAPIEREKLYQDK